MDIKPNTYLLGFSELLIYISLFLSSTPLLAGSQSKYGLNLYSLFLLVGCFLKFIPEVIMKNFVKIKEYIPYLKSKDGDMYSGIYKNWKRPENAKFCGVLGPFGKEEALTAGMPSGHSAIIAYIVTILLFNMVEFKREKKMEFSYLFIIFIVLMGVLVPLSRVELGCHTYPQVIIGCIVGFIIGFIMYMIDKSWLRKYETFAKDREEFYKLLSK